MDVGPTHDRLASPADKEVSPAYLNVVPEPSVIAEAVQPMRKRFPVKTLYRDTYGAAKKYLGSMYIEIWIADRIARRETVSSAVSYASKPVLNARVDCHQVPSGYLL